MFKKVILKEVMNSVCNFFNGSWVVDKNYVLLPIFEGP